MLYTLPELRDPTETWTAGTTGYSLDAAPRPGELRLYSHPTYGWQWYRCVKNATGGALTATGLVLSFVSGSSQNVGLAAAADPRGRIAGIGVSTIPDGYFAWVVCGGVCLAVSDAAITVNTELAVATASGNGRVDDTAGGAGVSITFFAHALAATTGAAESFQVRVYGLI